MYYLNTEESPFEVVKESSQDNFYISKQIQREEWFQQLRQLSEKGNPFKGLETEAGESFDGLADLAASTNDYVVQKLMKNNYKRVVVQFTI